MASNKLYIGNSGTEIDTPTNQLPQPTAQTNTNNTSSGGIGAWISSHKLMLSVGLAGGIIALIAIMYFRNQQVGIPNTAGTTTDTTGTTTDGTTSYPSVDDGTTSSTGAPDYSQLQNALSAMLADTQQVTAQELQESTTTTPTKSTSTTSTTTSNKTMPPTTTKPTKSTSTSASKPVICPDGTVQKPGTHCKPCVKCPDGTCQKKGTHCKPAKKKGGSEMYDIGGSYIPISSDQHQDMHVSRNTVRSIGHRMIYALGGGTVPMRGDGGGMRMTSYGYSPMNNSGGGFGRYAFARTIMPYRHMNMDEG